MSFVKRALTTTALSAGLLAGAAQAAIITVDDDLTGSRYLSAGGAIGGTFDLRPYLEADSVIDWARVTFYFEDDSDPLRYSSSGSYTSGYRRTYTDDPEQVSVSTLGQSATAMTTSVIERSYTPGKI